MQKNKITVYFCYALWSSANIYYIRDKFIETCKEVGVRYELIDVDTEDGAKFSVKHGFRNVPIMLVFKDGKEIDRVKGNNCFVSLLKYL